MVSESGFESPEIVMRQARAALSEATGPEDRLALLHIALEAGIQAEARAIEALRGLGGVGRVYLAQKRLEWARIRAEIEEWKTGNINTGKESP